MSNTTTYSFSKLIELSKFTGDNEGSNGDLQVKLDNNIRLGSVFTIPVDSLGDSNTISKYVVNGVPAIFVESATGIDAWFGLYLFTESVYKLYSGHSYDWDMTKEDAEFSELKPVEKVKFLYLKGIKVIR